MIAPPSNAREVATSRMSNRGHRPLFILCTVAMLAIAVACVVVFFRHTDEIDTQKSDKCKPAPAMIIDTSTVSAVKPSDQIIDMPKDAGKRYEDGVEVLSSSITTNANGITVERLILANGKRKKKVRHPKPIFEFSSDDLIAMAISVKPGESMPPMPIDRNIDKEFAQSLFSPIRIHDDDTDEIKELKAKVIETRAYLAEEIKRGGTVYDALMAHQTEIARINDNRLMAIQEMQKVKEELGQDAAIEFRDRVNESFRIRGIPEIGIKPSDNQRGETES